MATNKASRVELLLRRGALEATDGLGELARVVEVVLTNRTTSQITVVLAARYFVLEMKSPVGQYLKGHPVETTPLSLPTARDYPRLSPGASAVFPLSLSWLADADDGSVGDYVIGGYRFTAVPARNTLRVTYRADQIMPNLPNADRRLFFGGPLDDTIELLRGELYREPPPASKPE